MYGTPRIRGLIPESVDTKRQEKDMRCWRKDEGERGASNFPFPSRYHKGVATIVPVGIKILVTMLWYGREDYSFYNHRDSTDWSALPNLHLYAEQVKF